VLSVKGLAPVLGSELSGACEGGSLKSSPGLIAEVDDERFKLPIPTTDLYSGCPLEPPGELGRNRPGPTPRGSNSVVWGWDVSSCWVFLFSFSDGS